MRCFTLKMIAYSESRKNLIYIYITLQYLQFSIQIALYLVHTAGMSKGREIFTFIICYIVHRGDVIYYSIIYIIILKLY